ncbi:MAG: outer membrane beta-barrel protein [Pseudomonadota bacterium]
MTRTVLKGALCAATAALALQTAGAFAQERDFGIRPALPDYRDELGIRRGAFTIRPELNTSIEFTDNAFFSETQEEEDFILRVAPSVSVESEWSRHALRASAGAAYGFFFDNQSDNYVDAFGELQGVYDISRIASVRATGLVQRQHDRRGNIDVANAAIEPVEYTTYTGRVDGRYKPNRVRISPFAEYSFRDFEDNSTIFGIDNNDDRDRGRVAGGLEIGYEFLRGYEAFVRAQLDSVNYSDSVDDQGLDRDSVGVAGLAGVRFELTRLLVADLGVGYISRDYDDANLDRLTGITALARANWSVTPLTHVVLSVERDIEETTTAGASGAFATIGEVEVVHSLRRDLLISAFANVVDRDFEGGFRQDNSYGVGVGAEYSLNPNFSFEGRYEYSRRDSNAVGRDFSANQVFLGLTAKY